MAIPQNRIDQSQRLSEQAIHNASFDETLRIACFLMYGYDIANSRGLPLICDGIGRLATTNDLFIKNISYVASGNGAGKEEYVGYAEPGSADASAVWQIQKLVYDSNNKISTVRYADGDLKFNNIWDNRASLSYS